MTGSVLNGKARPLPRCLLTPAGTWQQMRGLEGRSRQLASKRELLLCLENGDLGGANSPNAPPPQLAWQAVASDSHLGGSSFLCIIVGKLCQPAKGDPASHGRRLAGPLNYYLLLDRYPHLLEVRMGMANLRR